MATRKKKIEPRAIDAGEFVEIPFGRKLVSIELNGPIDLDAVPRGSIVRLFPPVDADAAEIEKARAEILQVASAVILMPVRRTRLIASETREAGAVGETHRQVVERVAQGVCERLPAHLVPTYRATLEDLLNRAGV